MTRLTASTKPDAASERTWFALTVLFVIKPGRMTEFLPMMRENAHLSVTEEPGCLRFDVLTPEKPSGSDQVFLYEVYESRAAFDEHLRSAHYRSFDAGTREMLESKTVEFYAAWVGEKN